MTKQDQAQSRAAAASRPPIAVVGVSALFPGSLDSTGFWRDILDGADMIEDVPPSHWLIEDYYDPDPSVPDKTYAKRGAFLKDVDFDSLGWGVPPSLIPETDTSQLLALIVAQKVLEDACGHSAAKADALDRSKVSVILGVTSGQELLGSMVSRLQRPIWVKALRDSGIPEDEVQAVCDRISANYTPWKESTFPGLLGNVVAGRIANRLDLGGTNCVTDAACASTFSALSMAANELYLGDSDMVITGGVDTMNDIFMYMCFSKTPALSPTGDCRPFSDQADGTMLGEGLGMVALKRLEDAERDGDRVYAVINGVGASSDGRAKSVYAPRPEGQAQALRRAYELAGFGPEQVELVEAHGTGTKAGDAAEFKGLASAFSEAGREEPQWCTLGSVKSQIGHAKAAAAAAGLFKAVMALHHKVLPPTIKVDRPNPALEIEQSPFHLATRARPWVRDSEHPRRAGVSSFGFGGSNFHVALSEYAPGEGSASRRAPRLRALGCELVVLSAQSPDLLVSAARSYGDQCAKPGALAWLARSSQEGFEAADSLRLAIVASDEEDLAAKLAQAAKSIDGDPTRSFETPTGIYYRSGEASSTGGLAYLFSGQGSQYLHMGGSLAMQFGRAIAPWDRAASFDWDAPRHLQDVVFPPTAFTEDDKREQERTLSATEWAQPAIGCTSLSLLALLDGLGLQADCVGGHSFGEITALHAAGVLSESDFLAVARRRGELMAQAAVNPGAMVAVAEPIERVRSLLAEWGTDVVIANHNAPEQVVLSGKTTAIEAIEEQLGALKIKARRLPVATAFHSPVVEKASGAFGEFLDEVELCAAQRPVYSNTTGRAHDPSPAALRTMLAKQLASPVQYVTMIESMYEAGVRCFVEVGPGSVQTGLVTRILGERPHAALSFDRKGKDGVRSFLEALARLSVEGRALDFESLWAEFDAPENPQDRAEPKLKIALNGSNYGKPYPPPGGAAELPSPNPPREKEVKMDTAPIQNSAPVPAPAAEPPNQAQAAQPLPAPPLQQAPVAQAVQAPVAAPMSQPLTALAPAAIPAPGMAQAYQDAQRQTAEAHIAFVQAMAQTHSAYLETIDRSFHALSGRALPSTPIAPLPQLQPQPQLVQQQLQAPIFAAPVAPAPLPVAAMPPAPAMAPAAPAVQPMAPVVPAQPVAAPTVQEQPTAPDVDLHALLLQVVSEKTGYPPEMLTIDMELEADLGIDSIKRVEILSAMNDLAPGLPEVDTAVMAKLATLGEVVDYMNGQLAAVSASPAGAAGAPVATAAPAPNAVTTTAPPSAQAADIDLHALLLEVVSEKTGYPPEMLTIDMELEADLGIDSIKRVEILSAMNDLAPGLPEVDTAVMAKLATLGEVVDYMNGQLAGMGGGAPAIQASGDEAAAATDQPPRVLPPGIGRYVLDAVEQPAIGLAQSGMFGDGLIAVTDEGTGVAQALVAALAARGVAAEAVSGIPTGDVRGVIFLGGLRAVSDEVAATAINREAFEVAQSVAARFEDPDNHGVFVTVQDTGGAFGTDAFEAPRAWLAGCAGLARTVAQEWPGGTVKAVDLERAGREPSQLADAIADELLLGGPDLDVGLSAKGRRVVLRSRAVDVVRGAPVLCDGDVVVASGGARGVTATTLIALAGEARLRLLLLGRTPLSAEPACCAGVEDDAGLKRALLAEAISQGQKPKPAELGSQVGRILANREVAATLAAIESAGSEARYVALDVTSLAAVSEAIDALREEWGGIAAIVHGAGVIADKRVSEKSAEHFDRVFNTKVEGLRTLLAATAADPLKLLCLFSSVAARCGNVGQVDYAMANEVLNKVAAAEFRRREGRCLVKSLGWGPWEGGMVSPQLKAHFESLGVPLIPLAVGAKMLVDEVAGSAASQVELVLGGEPKPEALNPQADGRSFRVDVAVGPESHPYLVDHAIRGTPVVPVTLVVEWFARAARAFGPELVLVRLLDLKVLRGASLADFALGPKQFTVRCRQLTNGQGATLALELADREGGIYYRCTAELAAQRGEPGPSAGDAHGLVLEDWGDAPVYDGELLFHGPAFQMIRSIGGISEQGMVAELCLADALGTPAEVAGTIDPLTLDGGLQLALLWCKRALGAASLPTGIAEIRIFSNAPFAAPIRCTLVGREAARQRSVCDLSFHDANGHLAVEFIGVETHLLPDQGQA